MKFNKSILVFLGTIFFVSILFTGCLHSWNKIPDNCFDGIRNNGEEKVDCGGPCITCNPCENGLWDYQLGETWVDCGGDCCECPPHANGCQDAGESGIDCGGTSGIDCESLCNDGLVNGWEDGAINPITEQPYECGESPDNIGQTIPDCGGTCDVCPSCEDLVLNQGETSIDCGGPCFDCIPISGGSCINGIQDGFEIDVDCGALPPTQGYCPTCPILLECDIAGVHYDFDVILEVMQTEYLAWTSSLGTTKKTVRFYGVSTTDNVTIEGHIVEPELIGWVETSPAISIFCTGATWDAGSPNESSFLEITFPDGLFGPLTTKEIFQPNQGIIFDNFTKLYMVDSGYIWGSFSGSLQNGQGYHPVSNGHFKLIVPWN